MQDTIIGLVIDRSGSMAHVTNDTINGVNQFLSEQRTTPGRKRLSMTLFANDVEARFVAQDLIEVPAMTSGYGPNPYVASGGTALLDAVGTTIKGIEQWVEKHNFKGKVLMTILTDGQENASREWHIRQPLTEGDDRDLGGLISWKQKEGWEFLFLGAGGSDWLERTFGHVVEANHFYGYQHSGRGSAETFAGVSATYTNSILRGADLSNSNLVSNSTSMSSGPEHPQTINNLAYTLTTDSSLASDAAVKNKVNRAKTPRTKTPRTKSPKSK